jgi:Ras-related protein Rab-11A
MLTTPTEIYRIVSSKALDQGDSSQNVLDANRRPLDISTPADDPQKKNGCC